MFSIVSNTAFNNGVFSYEKLSRMKKDGQSRHESLQRLLAIALETKIDGPAALAAALVESEQTVTNWGRRGVSRSGAMKAQAKFGCSANWVLQGTLPRLVGGEKISEEQSNVSTAQLGARQIPLIDYVQAGGWTEVADSFQPGDAEDWLLTDLNLSSAAFALQIKGESMRPDFTPGDRVIIDPDVQPQAGDFVVAKNGKEEATFKKYRVRGTDQAGSTIFELVPLNPDFETMRSDERPIRIVGVMVEHRKYRKKR